jgi:hypothetical protein
VVVLVELVVVVVVVVVAVVVVVLIMTEEFLVALESFLFFCPVEAYCPYLWSVQNALKLH